MIPEKIMLLGSGELGRELVISLKRLGRYVIAVDNYDEAPAMQVADQKEVVNMLEGDALESLVVKHRPDLIVPEIEAIRTTKLKELEERGYKVIPTAEATYLTMNRDAIRDMAAKELGLRTARYAYAESSSELEKVIKNEIGLPCVVKPVMSSSGKGQSIVREKSEMKEAWDYAVAGMRGDEPKVIIEEFIDFKLEITLLTVRQKNGETVFVNPIAHRQERGDYQESWMPAGLTLEETAEAQRQAKQVTDRLGGQGLFGVEFFITDNEVIFSELSPRPHDTGMVTLISQDLSEFDLHARAILGLPIPRIQYHSQAAASAVILASERGTKVNYRGLEEALRSPGTDVRIFRKPTTRPYRRMGVALARGESAIEARRKATEAASCIEVVSFD